MNRILSIVFALMILAAVTGLGYILATPEAGEKFTEFYLLGARGKASDYPEQLRVGQEGRVTVGVVNREHQTVCYVVIVRIDGIERGRVGSHCLAHDERWEEPVIFALDKAEDNQHVEFLLYKNEQSDYSLRLYLSVDTYK